MRLKYSISLFCILLLGHALHSQSKRNLLDCHKTYNVEELKKDFNILKTTLIEVHPDPYRVSSREKVKKKIQSIEQSISIDTSYLGFLRHVAELLTDIGCINTQWGHSREYINYRNQHIPLFPLKFKIENDLFIVEKNWSINDSIKIGDTIVAINDWSVEEYLAKNYALLPTDGHIKAIQNKWLAMAFPKHHSNFWEQPEVFVVKTRSKDDVIQKIKLKADLNGLIESRKKHADEKTISPPSLVFSDSIAIIKSHSFNDQFIPSLDSIFDVIKQKNVKNLILDLRSNSFRWGEMRYGFELYSYLIGQADSYGKVKPGPSIGSKLTFDKHITQIQVLDKEDSSLFASTVRPKTNRFTGNLFILSNGWNIGASGFLIAKLIARPSTYYLGEKSGSSTFGMNFKVLLLELPYSKIQIYIPKYQLIANVEDYTNKSGISINYPIIDDENSINKAIEYIKDISK